MKMFRLIANEVKNHAPFVTLGGICVITIGVIFATGNMSLPIFLLSCLASIGDIGGGALPLYPRLKGISTRYILGFASGIVIAAAFFELLPEANVEVNWALVGAGFFIMYLIDKGLALHQCGESECEITGVSWVTVVGMASDNIVDGASITVAYHIRPLLAVVVTLAIIAHEIPQGIASTLVMRNQNYRTAHIIELFLLAGLMYPLGASLSSFIPKAADQLAIAFVAGVFIYVGATALMTEAHRRLNRSVMLYLMLGAAVALGLKFFE
jgi:zinc transporter ZupT